MMTKKLVQLYTVLNVSLIIALSPMSSQEKMDSGSFKFLPHTNSKITTQLVLFNSHIVNETVVFLF